MSMSLGLHLAPREGLSARYRPKILEISVELRGIEPLTSCLQSVSEASVGVRDRSDSP